MALPYEREGVTAWVGVWRGRRLFLPPNPGRYLVKLTEEGVPRLADDCDWFVLEWREGALPPAGS